MSEKCGCEMCKGERGGVPGNENIIDGRKVCDNCHATLMSSHKDMFGRPIKVGDFIVYGAVDGRSGTLRAGQVLELRPATFNWRGQIEAKVFVKSWSNFRAQGWAAPDTKRSGRQKNVTLGFLDRLIVVPEEIISSKVKADLEGGVANYQGQV